jgi:hypothetical protein
MTIEQTWRASSANDQGVENADLSKLAGIWSAQLDVTISNPVVIDRASIEHRFSPEFANSPKDQEVGYQGRSGIFVASHF